MKILRLITITLIAVALAVLGGCARCPLCGCEKQQCNIETQINIYDESNYMSQDELSDEIFA